MAAKLNAQELLKRKTPPELDEVPRRGLDENGAIAKLVASADHWYRAWATSEELLRATERDLFVARARLKLLRWPWLTILTLAAMNAGQAIAYAIFR